VNEPLRITLHDAARFLRAEGIAYALIGGLAVSIRGQTRVTADVDLVVAADVERALSLAGALAGSPFQPLVKEVDEIITTAFLLPLRHRATGVKVDIAIGLSGFEQQAIARSEALELGGCMVPVATAEDLLILKLLAGRPQDEEDIRGLLIAQGEGLDWDYCLKTATELGEAVGQELAGRVRALRRGSP
jgi:hypothetical protein